MIVQHHSSKTTSKACCLQVHRKLSHKKKSRHECVRPWWTLLIIVSKTSWKVLSDIFARTFIRIKHRIRPSTEPCGTPVNKVLLKANPIYYSLFFTISERVLRPFIWYSRNPYSVQVFSEEYLFYFILLACEKRCTILIKRLRVYMNKIF